MDELIMSCERPRLSSSWLAVHIAARPKSGNGHVCTCGWMGGCGMEEAVIIL